MFRTGSAIRLQQYGLDGTEIHGGVREKSLVIFNLTVLILLCKSVDNLVGKIRDLASAQKLQ